MTLILDQNKKIELQEWDIYPEVDGNEISKTIRPPGWVFDSRFIVDKQKVLSSGLNLWRVGDGKHN